MFRFIHPIWQPHLPPLLFCFLQEELCEPHQLWKSSSYWGHQIWRQIECTVLLPPTQRGHLGLTPWVWISNKIPQALRDTSMADVCIHIMHVVLRAVSRDHVFWPSLCSFPWNNPCQSCMTKESWHSCYPKRSAMSLWTAKLPLYHHSFALQARWIWSYFILRDEILWCRECSGIAKWVAKNDMGGDLNRGRDNSFQAIPVLTEKELPYPNTTLYR